MKYQSRILLFLLYGLCGVGIAGTVQTQSTAGVKPHTGPESAPIFNNTEHDQKWLDQAMTGVEKPYPKSLNFMRNQGNWYTPFAAPGMRAPYDIRGWHKQ